MTNSQNKHSVFQIVATTFSVFALIISVSGLNPLGASVTSVAASDNLMLNSQFKAADYGTSAIASSTGSGTWFSNRWRAKHGNASSSATYQRIDQYTGGAQITLSNTSEEYFYVRQTLPGLKQFDSKTFTVRADFGSVDSGLNYDFYINARWNLNDDINVLDTTQQSLSSGAAATASFTVPDLSGYGYSEDSHSGLEIALRIHSPSTQTNTNVDLEAISFYEGSNLSSYPITDVNAERGTLNTYYEKSDFSTSIVGLDPTLGQKRATIQMTTHKRKGVDYQLEYYDALGNLGRVSIYETDGKRVDNVVPDSVRKSNNSVIFVFFDSNISGVGLSWIADSEI